MKDSAEFVKRSDIPRKTVQHSNAAYFSEQTKYNLLLMLFILFPILIFVYDFFVFPSSLFCFRFCFCFSFCFISCSTNTPFAQKWWFTLYSSKLYSIPVHRTHHIFGFFISFLFFEVFFFLFSRKKFLTILHNIQFNTHSNVRLPFEA